MKEYRYLLKVLRKRCPLAFPLVVRRVNLEHDGVCYHHKKKFHIRINKKLSQKNAIETLLHEYSHALDWKHAYDAMDEEELDRRCHGASWGVAYAEIYRIYEQHFLGCFTDLILDGEKRAA